MANGLFIDYEYCTGCRSCEIACRNERGFGLDQWGIKVEEVGPFAVGEGEDDFVWNYTPMLTKLCDLCEGRVARGDVPSCQLHCLASVIEYGDAEELAKRLAEKGKMAYVVLP